jgi:hypothetical protein
MLEVMPTLSSQLHFCTVVGLSCRDEWSKPKEFQLIGVGERQAAFIKRW